MGEQLQNCQIHIHEYKQVGITIQAGPADFCQRTIVGGLIGLCSLPGAILVECRIVAIALSETCWISYEECSFQGRMFRNFNGVDEGDLTV